MNYDKKYASFDTTAELDNQPDRSEKADFGHGDTTGVQTL
jgi:hypothetical protein